MRETLEPLNPWSKKTIEWVENGTAYVSVPFTWLLQKAYQRCVALRQEGYDVRAGGPAVDLLPEYLVDVAKLGGKANALPHHNPNATFTSRGCIRQCEFCAVPKIEGQLHELADWDPKPVVCDNNLLACSRPHFDKVVDRLKGIQGIDFNQGLDVRLLSNYHIDRLRELNITKIRLAWDEVKFESKVMTAIRRLRKAGFSQRRIGVYVLIGYKDTPQDARYRLETLKSVGIRPNPQRFNPLDTLRRDSFVDLGWTDSELRRYMRYWSRQVWLEHIPFDEYQG